MAWALRLRPARPDAGGAVTQAGVRLDVALRSFFAEQGTKRVPKETIWRLVGGATQLRLTAQSLAAVSEPDMPPADETRALLGEAVRLAGVCDDLASEMGRQMPTVAQELAKLPRLDNPSQDAYLGYSSWVRQHLEHVEADLDTLSGDAALVGAQRARPWWR